MGGHAEARVRTEGDLATVLDALANPLRLSLLHRLERPAFVPDLVREFDVTRQALRKHLHALEEAGLVHARPARRGALPATAYCTDPAGLFAFKERVRGIAITPDPGVLPPTRTQAAHTSPPVGRTAGAGLLLVHGDVPGRWYALAARESVILGRDPRADVSVAYDPFASARHALLRRDGDAWTLTDLHTTNGTCVNFRPLRPGQATRVHHGDLLTVGRSHLVLRDSV